MIAEEALAAVTGIWPTKAPDRDDFARALALPDVWRRRLVKILESEKPEEADWPEPPEEEALWRKISTPPALDDMQAVVLAIGDTETAIGYGALLQRARDHLVSVWPVVEIGEIVPERVPLPPDDLAEMAMLTRTLGKPAEILEDFAAWALLPSQVRAMAEVYPELWAMFLQILDEAIIDRTAKKKDIGLAQSEIIKIARQVPPTADIVVAQKPEPPSPPVSRGIKYPAYRTKSEELEAP